MGRKKRKLDKKPNWSDLPSDILRLISNRLLYIKDYVRFGAVCRPWHSIYIENPRIFSHQLPMLMFFARGCLNRKSRYLYDIFEKNYINTMKLTIPRDTKCIGSSHGWLITIHEKDNSISLLNPFLSDDNVIELPPLENGLSEESYILRVALSANPTYDHHYVVMVIYCPDHYFLKLAYYNPKNQVWVSLNQKDELFLDIIYHKDQFYAVDNFGILWKCDTSDYDLVKVTSQSSIGDSIETIYLVESGGELLQVRRSWELRSPYLTTGFTVLKLDTSKFEWDDNEINDLSGRALFLGDNTSISLLASDFSGCMPNCIYFAEEWYFKKYKMQHEHDVGVYNMEDGSSKPLPSFNSMARNFPSPIWIEPTLRRHPIESL